jgi:hypothetical protein
VAALVVGTWIYTAPLSGTIIPFVMRYPWSLRVGSSVVGFATVTGIWLVLRRRLIGGPSLLPESLFVVTITDDELRLQGPDGKSSAVAWKDITLVKIRTTSAGPWAPDVFWFFETRDQQPAVVVVGGATGEQEMIRALNERLPGFDDEMVIKAMGSTSDREFVCWQSR